MLDETTKNAINAVLILGGITEIRSVREMADGTVEIIAFRGDSMAIFHLTTDFEDLDADSWTVKQVA